MADTIINAINRVGARHLDTQKYQHYTLDLYECGECGCILLITHRESLRDRLPQQITVTKNGAGSEVTLAA